MNLSFREWSLWGHTVLIIWLFGMYFFKVLSGGHFNGPVSLSLLAGTVISFIVLEIVYHVIIGVVFKDQRRDERDRQVELRGVRLAALVLGIGIFMLMGQLLAQELSPEFIGSLQGSSLTTIGIINVLFAVIVLAELTEHASQLVYYRLGV